MIRLKNYTCAYTQNTILTEVILINLMNSNEIKNIAHDNRSIKNIFTEMRTLRWSKHSKSVIFNILYDWLVKNFRLLAKYTLLSWKNKNKSVSFPFYLLNTLNKWCLLAACVFFMKGEIQLLWLVAQAFMHNIQQDWDVQGKPLRLS